MTDAGQHPLAHAAWVSGNQVRFVESPLAELSRPETIVTRLWSTRFSRTKKIHSRPFLSGHGTTSIVDFDHLDDCDGQHSRCAVASDIARLCRTLRFTASESTVRPCVVCS